MTAHKDTLEDLVFFGLGSWWFLTPRHLLAKRVAAGIAKFVGETIEAEVNRKFQEVQAAAGLYARLWTPITTIKAIDHALAQQQAVVGALPGSPVPSSAPEQKRNALAAARVQQKLYETRKKQGKSGAKSTSKRKVKPK